MPHRTDRRDGITPRQRVLGSLALLGFGLALLAFLVMIERQNWFHVRPATGAARAMSLASDRAPTPQGAPQGAAPQAATAPDRS